MTSIPNEVLYTELPPKGFATSFKEWPVDPMSSNVYWNPNDIVRFLLNLTQGYMDPFRSYFQLEVEIDPALKIGSLQLDGSAQSFISQLVISSNNVEIERIGNYDLIADILTDLGTSEDIAKGREVEGLGTPDWVPADTNRFPRGGSPVFCPGKLGESVSQYGQCSSQSAVSPTKMLMSPIAGETWRYWNDYYSLTSGPVFNCLDWSSSQLTENNPWANDVSPCIPNNRGYIGNVRAEYLSGLSSDVYVQTPASMNKSGFTVLGSENSGTYGNINKDYSISYTPYQMPHGPNGFSQANICGANGYESAWSPYFSTGSFEPFLSNTVMQGSMINGKIQKQMFPVNTKTFLVPVLSSTIGILIQPSSYKLIPLKTLNNLLLEITLNPFAMFSSGYSDRNEWDANGMTQPIPRSFRIKRFQYVLSCYEFNDESMMRYTESLILKGIRLTSYSYSIGNQYQIPNAQILVNAWPINATAQSMSGILIAFLPNDYQKWPFCRRLFRLSNSITSMQFRYDTVYTPPQPIRGNAGNPEQVMGMPDNSQFYMNLLRFNNYLFNTNFPMGRINRYNFAINERCYDPTDTRTMLPAKVKKPPNTYDVYQLLDPLEINANTAMGAPSFHENRCVGKALYCWSFEPFALTGPQLYGVNLSQSRTFEVMFDVQPGSQFTRDQTMYIIIKANAIVSYSDGGITVTQ